MTIRTFNWAEAPSFYPLGFHPAYWRFPEGQDLYTGIIKDIREEKPYPGKPGTNLVIEVVNGPYGGKIRLNTHTTSRTELSRVISALGALEQGRIAPARLLQAIGRPIAFKLDQFHSPDGRWHPVLRFGAVILQIIPLSPGLNFGWSHPAVVPQAVEIST